MLGLLTWRPSYRSTVIFDTRLFILRERLLKLASHGCRTRAGLYSGVPHPLGRATRQRIVKLG